MKPMSIPPNEICSDHIGMVITRDQPTAGATYRKGHEITSDDLAVLATSQQRIHAVVLDDSDVPEALAVPMIANAIRGEYTTVQPVIQGRVNIRSTVRGLLRVDSDALLLLNSNPELGIFTQYSGSAVDADTTIAGVKIAPVAMNRSELESTLAVVISPIIEVTPFRPLSVTCIVTEQLQGRVRDRFQQTLHEKLDWYGAGTRNIVWLDEDPASIAAALTTAFDSVDLVFTAGSHMMDPLDATLNAVENCGAELIRLGAPAHPGSMVWAAWHEPTQTPILSLASCSMFSRSTVADLIMPAIFAGERVTNETFARLGYGGLLDRGMDWRFPPYRTIE